MGRRAMGYEEKLERRGGSGLARKRWKEIKKEEERSGLDEEDLDGKNKGRNFTGKEGFRWSG